MLAWGPVLLILGAASVQRSHAAMSMQAFKQAKLMMEGVCQPKTGVSKELMSQLKKGEFPDSDDRKLKCYFECILRMGRVMQGTKVSSESLRRLARTMLPTQLQPLVMPSIEACQDIAEGDACDAAYVFAKCHHKISGAEGFMFS
uniref:Uncharacterized protein n=1 Tax=Graphocephala atropunctata TaxID=36148 RepID=A0A1B6KWP3_9HEMI